MKPFFVKLMIFIVGLSLLFPIKTFYLLKNNRFKEVVLGYPVYLSIEKSKKRNPKAKTLIIGDSVGQQLFKNAVYNDTIYSLTCNQAISMAGQYFLLEDFLEKNPEVQKVILIYTPKSFKNNLDQQYTFNYFLKPFYNDQYKDRFSLSVINQIKKIPLYYISQFPPILTSDWTPDYFPNVPSEYYISPISEEYLTKIIKLCNKDSVKFIILPTPTRLSYKFKIADFSKNVTYTNYDFKDYFSKIFYIPDSCFLDDVHFKDPQKYVGWYINIMNNL